MSIADNNEGYDLIKDIEARRGAPMGYRTFSTFYADSDGNVCDYGVFLYECEDRFWYEDFEHEASFLGIKIRTRKQDDYKYEKFESSFPMSDVVSTRRVRKSPARRCAWGEKSFDSLRKANPVLSFFSAVVTEFVLKDGRRLYFELMDKSVLEIIRKHNDNI